MHIFKPACVNRSNQLYLMIRPNSFSHIVVSFKKCGNLASELNNKHNPWKISMAPLFSKIISAGMGLCRPLPLPSSSSLPYTCHTLFLRRWRSFLDLFVVKWRSFSYLPMSGGGSGGWRQLMIVCHLWLVTSRYFTYIISD